MGLPKQILRTHKRLLTRDDDFFRNPPVLANSFPKSGTHMMLQILEALPGVKNYGTFIASMPSITFKERSKIAHIKILNNLVPGELSPAHLVYHPDYEDTLSKKKCIHFFIYRDPRDVVVSEAYYLTNMNRWHRMHSYYKCLKSMDERISMAILGVMDLDFPYDYPNVVERFKRYCGWLKCQSVFSVKFEDLMTHQRRKVLIEIINNYADRSSKYLDTYTVVQAIESNINPHRSHTFRKGHVGGWREEFTENHKEQMKSIAGELLIDLGYEKDLSW